MKARNNQSEILRLQYRMTARRTWAGAWCAVNGACMGCSLQKDICCCPAPRLRLQLYTDAWMSCQCVWETRGRTKPHTHTCLHNRRRHVLLLTFTPATDSGCQLENESINLKRKKKKKVYGCCFWTQKCKEECMMLSLCGCVAEVHT